MIALGLTVVMLESCGCCRARSVSVDSIPAVTTLVSDVKEVLEKHHAITTHSERLIYNSGTTFILESEVG